MDVDDARQLRAILNRWAARLWEPLQPQFTYDYVRQFAAVQTEIFAIDLLPYIHWMLRKLPWNTHLRILDAGCGIGSGAEMLGRLHQTNFLGHSYEVVGIDSSSVSKPHADAFFDHMTYTVGDIFDLEDGSFDVVICSHVIEHIPDPTDFIKKLQRVATRFALFYCPFEEKNLRGHVVSITREYVERLEPAFVEVRGSMCWHNPLDEVSRCILFALPGDKWAMLGRDPAFNWGDRYSILPIND
jgi:SAM-dependent methyltransferase